MGKIGKANFWKVLLSYVYEYPLERTSSPYNPELSVFLKNGRYQLCTRNAIYSYDDLYTNFSQAFKKVDVANRSIQDVLVLGLGLGSIPLILEKVFHQKYHITAVEIDEEVIYLANKYVLSELASPIDCICANALHFVMQSQEQYDLICMDVFKDDEIPDDFRSIAYLEQLKQMLNPEGILLFNHLALTSEDKKKATQYYREVFLQVFPDGGYIDARSNYVLTNDRKFVVG